MDSLYIHSVNGPVVGVKGGRGLAMYDTVYVGAQSLIGEVVNIKDDVTIVQVYEDTGGLKPGMPVTTTGAPLALMLGPGLVRGIFDGIARPLNRIAEQSGDFIARGVNVDTIDLEKEWDITVTVKAGDRIEGGQTYAECQETPVIRHFLTLIPTLSGVVTMAKPSGTYKTKDILLTVTDDEGREHEVGLYQKWPIREPRPVKARRPASLPLITGQRIIDTLFPLAKGGAAAIPGPFGAGKTITQHQLAKWSDADIIVYIGCGERGNEMTEVLEEFTHLIDPKTKSALTDRTILIANTSNMPVASREASIYTGITIAEYYRDMGYHVAIMADSTSRWAEALRELSGRLEEMPAEEGYPAYLPSRLAAFYERAGYMDTLNGKPGSITVIGAVSPQGSDFSEPVTQNTKRFTRTFWALDRQLAYARHFPSINWITSYSEYLDDLDPWYEKTYGLGFIQMRKRIAVLLQEESSLMEIVKLIGSDILPDDQKLIIEIARIIRVGFLQQNAYHDVDTYTTVEKQERMMELILFCNDRAKELLSKSIPIGQLKASGIFDDLIKMKFDIKNEELEKFDELKKKIDSTINKIVETNR